ncbi:ABC-three component system protein [Caulobacter segnis]|uniref:ABC-three component system protein n=1 Tax=Caulobacter segnis TaxID=88688 RepID=UPI00285E08EE|nr:ABC-three component system protein [Caulobacter segnis]MDR6624474.1 hypothetical protein [Caulobacter segnis]
MDDLDWAWQEMALKVRLSEIDGDAFESFFAAIAKAAWGDDFQATIPMGSRGDLKCDGYRRSEGRVFQLYGPRYGQAKVDDALKKIDEDFRGAKAHWGSQMRSWTFVAGLYASRTPSEILLSVADLDTKLGVPAKVWSRDDIIALAKTLSSEDRRRLLGAPPQRADMVRHVTYENIGRALTYVRGHQADSDLAPVSLPPPIDVKAQYNLLSAPAKRFLSVGQTGAAHVQRYLSDQVDPSEAQRMADGFSTRYKAVVAEGAEPDAAFGAMVGYAGGGSTDMAREAAALAVVAHFFSTCEIFDRPPADWQPAT